MDETNSRVIANAAPSFPSFIALRARHSELLQRDPITKEEQAEYLHDAEEFVKQVQTTGAHLSDDDERRASQNILNYWVSMLFRADDVPRLVTLARYDPGFIAPLGDFVCPYPGVRPFTEKDSQFFFGRQRQIDYMIGRLKEDRLLVIVGPSGSGKTSLVQAGLLPALKKEQPNSRQHFFFPPMVPGSEPLKSLALMINKAKDSTEASPEWIKQQVEHFKRDKTHLLKLIEDLTPDPAVIFIDQGEEIYENKVHLLLRPLENILDFDNSKEAIEPFLDNLMRVVQSAGRNHIVIIARRISDYEPDSKRLPSRVKEAFEPARVVLPALYASELCDAIQKPAELLGIKFEEAMVPDPDPTDGVVAGRSTETTVQALVKEISGEAVGLPLLQFALPRLWEKRTGNKIPDGALREMRSCRAALSDTAEEFYSVLPFLEQRTCRRLLLQLVTLDRELKPHVYPVRRTSLYRSTEKHARVDSLIDRLSDKQLIRVSKGEIPIDDDWVELTHDSLFSTWPRMVSWIEWQKGRRRWLQAAEVMGLGFLIAAFILGSLFLVGWQQQRTKSRDLARLSNKQLANNRLDLALLLGSTAYQTEVNIVTRSQMHKLLDNLQFTPQPERFLRKEKFRADDLSFTTEQDRPPSRLAAIDLDGAIVIWDLSWDQNEFAANEQTLVAKSAARPPLIFSADGKFLATASTDQNVNVILWDLTKGGHRELSVDEITDTESSDIDPDLLRTRSIVFSHNGEVLYSAGKAGSVIRWDLEGMEGAKGATIFSNPIPINSIALNTTGDSLAVGGQDGAIFLLDASGKRATPKVIAKGHTTEFIGDEPIYDVTFSKDGKYLAAGQTLFTSRIDRSLVWKVADGKLQREFCTGLADAGLLVSFSDDDRNLVGYSPRGNIFSWDIEKGVSLDTHLYQKANQANSASFSGNGRLLALPTNDGAIIWNISSDRVLSASESIVGIAFRPGGGDTLAVGDSGGVTSWEVKNSKEHEKLKESTEESEVVALAYSGDGAVLATGLHDGTVSLRDSNLESTRTLSRKGAEDEIVQSTAIAKLAFAPGQEGHRLVGGLNLNAQSPEQFSEIIVWNADTGEQVRTLELVKGSSLTAMAFRPDGKVLAWSFTDANGQSTVTLWDFIAQKQINNPINPIPTPAQVTSLAFSPDGKVLAVGYANGKIGLWGETYNEAVLIEGVVGEVADLAFSPDGSMLASATNPKSDRDSAERVPKLAPGTIVLWDMSDGIEDQPEQLGDRLMGHLDAITSIAFSSDGKLLASGSKDEGVLLWDVNLRDARGRICKIIDCHRSYQEMMVQLDKETPLQWFYRKIMRVPSLRELNQ
jgi:WD40 repeat protein/energy-coupling factor transporter ATP-binding protein EcfA2